MDTTPGESSLKYSPIESDNNIEAQSDNKVIPVGYSYLNGTVINKNGEPLFLAKITNISSTDDNIIYSDQNGNFSILSQFNNILEIEKIGYKTKTFSITENNLSYKLEKVNYPLYVGIAYGGILLLNIVVVSILIGRINELLEKNNTEENMELLKKMRFLCILYICLTTFAIPSSFAFGFATFCISLAFMSRLKELGLKV